MTVPQAMLGMIDIQTGTGAAGSDSAAMRPSDHEIWVINQMEIYHDDPAGGLAITYSIYDASNTVQFGTSAALAANAKSYLYDDCQGLPEPVVLTYDHYLKLETSGIAAGKKIYFKAAVTRFRGLPTGYGL